MGFQNLAFEVGEAAQRVSVYFRACVLRHDKPVLIIQIGQAECILGHIIEEFLLGFQVILHRLVIVQMVTRQVSEYTACKAQTADAFLGNGV